MPKIKYPKLNRKVGVSTKSANAQARKMKNSTTSFARKVMKHV